MREKMPEFLKKHKFISFLVILTVINCARFLCTGYERAVLLPEAWIKSLREEYFIIGIYQDWGNGGYYYMDGIEKIPVYVSGNSPEYELGAPISGEHANNKFLIKGYLDEGLSETAGKAVLWAEDWDIIAPIHRDFYTEDPNGRITGPRYYFDDYDVEIGLYQPAVTELKSLQWYEAEHIQKNSEKDCLLVTSEYCDGELQWYITDEWVVRDSDLTPVDLQGYDFEQTFSEQILDGGNHFLVCGRNEEEQGIFWVEEWYIAAPIYGKTKKGDWDAYNYYRNQRFTLEDVEAGYYVPNSYDIFYKKYKDGIGTNKDVTYPWIKGLEDEDVLSVVCHEFTINNQTTYVYYDNYAVTIDMHTGERMEIWDFIGMEEFDKQLLEGKFKSDLK